MSTSVKVRAFLKMLLKFHWGKKHTHHVKPEPIHSLLPSENRKNTSIESIYIQSLLTAIRHLLDELLL